FDEKKLALAREFGAETVSLSGGQDPVAAAQQFSRGRGVDAVLITASTKSDEPIHQAATMCRKRGRIVLVGVVGMQMSRADFYEKELTFQVSCSYGPGRYDPEYEEKGNDYPVGYVRWTEQRNFEAILDMMADGRLQLQPLISHRFSIDNAADAYDIIATGDSLGVLLEFDDEAGDKQDSNNLANSAINVVQLNPDAGKEPGEPVVGFIGAGNYASSVLVPAFAKTHARLKSIASATGVSSVHVGKKHGVESATTDADSLLSDPDINSVVIATRHDSHAAWVCNALENGKHVFVEKPLAINRQELESIVDSYNNLDSNPMLMVGFNRRYSPLVDKMRSLLETQVQPRVLVMTVNAGPIPADHWTQDSEVGGGRIIGEACHFVDLLRFLADSEITGISAAAIDSECRDTVTIQMQFANGSIGTVHYLANGSKSFPKERLEVFCGGGILQLDNFRVLKGYGWPGFNKLKLWRQDKGQQPCAQAFADAVSTGDAEKLIPLGELIEVATACFDVENQLR
ncbi:MAG: bi-domain-containing oxidoreductase, partial [Planctomycetota bacterium]|nr:bi-domain-containing oxidoreductase [Planctomycetota bacterium]